MFACWVVFLRNIEDIDGLLNDAEAFHEVVNALAEPWKGKVDLVAGPEARGYLFSSSMAYVLHAGVAMVRKPGKLPAEKISESYGLEYGRNEIEMHTTSVKKGQRGALSCPIYLSIRFSNFCQMQC